MPRLQIDNGSERGREIDFPSHRVITLGRNEDCDVHLPENSISRRHATIEPFGEGWLFRDLGSQNGSFIEGQRVDTKKLSDGDRIKVGDLVLRFYVAAAAKESNDGPKAPSLSAGTVVKADKVRDNGGQAAASEMSDRESIEQIKKMGAVYPRIAEQFSRIIVGQKETLEQVMIAIACNGNCLMIGLPGLAKTLMVSTLAQILQLGFKRVQFTPDLMPSDILGTEVLDINEATNEKSFRFIRGPVFTNMLLADEINRTPPKTQAALLESMQERQVSIANHTFPLPSPFFVLATQNPLEQEGTYPLPEAQLDRFMFNIAVDYPDHDEEEEIARRTTGSSPPRLQPVLSAHQTLDLQAAVRAMPVSRHIIKYATTLARATRPGDPQALSFVKEHVFCGAGPRATQNLILGAKGRAVINGRTNVSCEDVRHLALPVLRHRIFTNFTADSEGITPDDLIRKILAAVPEPQPQDYVD